MEHADRHAANAQAQHHVTKLRNRGVSQDAFDVRLRHGDGRGKNRRQCADPCHDLQRGGVI